MGVDDRLLSKLLQLLLIASVVLEHIFVLQLAAGFDRAQILHEPVFNLESFHWILRVLLRVRLHL